MKEGELKIVLWNLDESTAKHSKDRRVLIE
jgi:hypothetical protein